MNADAWYPLLFILVAAGIALAVGVYFLVRFLRGSIKIDLPRTAYAPGEEIAGSFEVKAKKPIESHRLVCRLIGKEVTATRSPGSSGRHDRTRTRSTEIFRDEIVIEEAKSYPAGHVSTHQFSIPVPGPGDAGQGRTALGTVMEVLTDRRTRLQWELSVRLEAKGVDLAASRSISIRL